MPVRRLPVRPDIDQLHRQAKELLRDIHAGEATAIGDLREFHPESIDAAAAKLADAQLVLARSYQASSWTRLGTSAGAVREVPPRQRAHRPSMDGRDHLRADGVALPLRHTPSGHSGHHRPDAQ